MKLVLIIPARFQSSRFPGKPLVDIAGKPLIQHVWEKCVQAIDSSQVYIATDNERIKLVSEKFGAQVVMTPDTCLTGTDRLFEVSKHVDADIYINVQGDEPLIKPDDIHMVMEAAKRKPDTIFNAMCPIQTEEEYRSPTVPKVVTTLDGILLYISRAPIPTTKEKGFKSAWKQVCIYAFPKEKLELFARQRNKTPIEAIEDIEILRFLELGYEVKMVPVSKASIAVDVPEDVDRVLGALAGD